MPRWFWWLVGLASSLDLSVNAWAFVHDRPHWHPGVALMSVVTIVVALVQLERRKTP
jgi:hypothetical protein